MVMKPGQVTCSQLANPAAVEVMSEESMHISVDWVVG